MASISRNPLLGLALGGGGARGFAHIGVLKILEADGIKPQLLAGTSMGAVIAAMYAGGMSAKEIEAEALRMGSVSNLGNMVKLLDSDLAKLSHVVSNSAVQEYLSDLFNGKKDFSELNIPLAVAAVDVMHARDVVLQEGNLPEAVSASMALPGIIEPLQKDGMFLVDGGSLNNVPADLVDSMGAEVVVAIDVSPDVTNMEFWNEQHMPGIAVANWRTNAIMVSNFTAAKLRKARTDLIIRPDIGPQITTLSGFRYVKELVDAGAKAALDALPELRKLLKARIYLVAPKIKRAAPAEL
jgi:Predicted esterase of the alpha-beta hydrolase superfamily